VKGYFLKAKKLQKGLLLASFLNLGLLFQLNSLILLYGVKAVDEYLFKKL
jgi:hypothetical protein